MRAPRFGIAVVLVLAACSDSSTNTPQDASNTPDNGSPMCPATIVSGAACSVEGLGCAAPEACVQCGPMSWARYAPPCLCTGGLWVCGHMDCGANPTCDYYRDNTCASYVSCDAGARDAGPDVRVDATSDVAMDVRSDVTAEVGAEVGSDAVADVAPDVAATDGCARPAVMVLTGMVRCMSSGDCPAGYECLTQSGFVAQRFCGRSCRVDCDCPATQSCGSYTDKAGTHPLCVSE